MDLCSLLAIYLGQTMVEVMKIMVTSFKRSHACAATLSAPSPAAGHHQPMSPLETPGQAQASLGQSLVGSLLLPPGSWCTQGSVYALQGSISQSCVRFGSSMVGLMVTSSKRAYAIPRSAAPRAPAPVYGPTEAEDIKRRWQEYTEELYKKDLHDPDNHDGVITHL